MRFVRFIVLFGVMTAVVSAAREVAHAQEEEPELPLALERAWQASRVQRWQACLKFAKESLASEGASALARYLQGAALLRLDRAKEAAEVLSRALAAPSQRFPAPRALLLSDLTQAALSDDKPDLARASIDALEQTDAPLASLAALTALARADTVTDASLIRRLRDVVQAHGDDEQKALAAALAAPVEEAAASVPAAGPREASSDASGMLSAASHRAGRDTQTPASGYFSLMASAAAGYDSNVEQTPNTGSLQIERDVFGAPKGGYYGTAALTLTAGRGNSRRSWDVGYTFFQLAYHDRLYEPLALQEHIAEVQYRAAVSSSWWVQSLASADASFSGLRGSYELFQVAPNAQLLLGVAYGSGWQSTAAVEGGHRQVMDADFHFLQGQRAAVSLATGFRKHGWQARLSLRARKEFLGNRLQSQDVRGPDDQDDDDINPVFKRCPSCTEVAAFTDYGFGAVGPLLWLSSPRSSLVSAMLVLSAERRLYGESGLLGRNEDDRTERHNVWRRQDDRGAANLFVATQPMRALRIGVRYGFSFNLSNVRGQHFNKCLEFESLCHPMHFQSRSFLKHMVSLELELTL